jgi:hypothetical protein
MFWLIKKSAYVIYEWPPKYATIFNRTSLQQWDR